MSTIYVILSLVVTIQAQMEGFIVGGDLTSIKRYPHSAFLTVTCVSEQPVPKRVTWICGSSIVNQRLLLTAGHCVYPCGSGTRIMVNMGNEYRFYGTSRTSTGFILHEKYCPNNSASDIALIKMSRPVQFNTKISRVAIMKWPPYSEPANLAGWGMTDVSYTYTYTYSFTYKSGLNLISASRLSSSFFFSFLLSFFLLLLLLCLVFARDIPRQREVV